MITWSAAKKTVFIAINNRKNSSFWCSVFIAINNRKNSSFWCFLNIFLPKNMNIFE